MLNSTVLLCTTPPRDALLPQTVLARRSELDLTFDLDSAAQLPASLAISGDAQINDEALALTANVPGQAGGFSVAPPQPELPLLYFSAEFELLLGGGEAEGGEGIHVFFGPAGETPPPLEQPRSEGVSMLLFTGSHYSLEDQPADGFSQQLRIFYNGTKLLQQDSGLPVHSRVVG